MVSWHHCKGKGASEAFDPHSVYGKEKSKKNMPNIININ
jgi:hypothetical protein